MNRDVATENDLRAHVAELIHSDDPIERDRARKEPLPIKRVDPTGGSTIGDLHCDDLPCAILACRMIAGAFVIGPVAGFMPWFRARFLFMSGFRARFIVTRLMTGFARITAASTSLL
jgi:hypothetical protein